MKERGLPLFFFKRGDPWMKWLTYLILLSLLLSGCGLDASESSPVHAEKEKQSIPTHEEVPSEGAIDLKELFDQAQHTQSTSEEIDRILEGSNAGIVPVKLEIPAIDVKAEIEPVGILDNGQMGVPSSAEGIGWYEPGTKPGGYGNAVLAGHVDSRTGPAIFYDLGELEPGDEVIVTDADGQKLTFIVTKKESYPRLYAPIQDIFGYTDSRHLNLITCTGTFNVKDGTHEERLVVYTKLKIS
jgi:sortase A